jgi:6-phosphogluconolactonase
MSAVEVLPDAASLARATAAHFVDQARVAVAARDRFAVALAGGSTPRATYTLLASEPLVHEVDWQRVYVFFGDERCVPPDHPDSNYRMARETLLEPAAVPLANVHRMHGEHPPDEAAVEYEPDLRAFFGSSSAPRFDLMLLGMGDNGHTQPHCSPRRKSYASTGAGSSRVTWTEWGCGD